MPYGLYVSAEGATAQGRRMEVISNNLANVETAGFKRDLAIFQARYAEAIEQGYDYPGSESINDMGGGVTVRETKTDFAPGPIEETGRPTDFAINGRGFFRVRNGNEELLTRAGNFTVSPSGQLITQQGYQVLDDAGRPIVVDQSLGPLHPADGGFSQGGTTTFLGVATPQSLGDLVKVGDNVFRSLAPTTPVSPAERVRSVLSGHLEHSGVKPTTEMMELIEASRAFEANVNLIRQHDQLLGNLVNRMLGRS